MADYFLKLSLLICIIFGSLPSIQCIIRPKEYIHGSECKCITKDIRNTDQDQDILNNETIHTHLSTCTSFSLHSCNCNDDIDPEKNEHDYDLMAYVVRQHNIHQISHTISSHIILKTSMCRYIEYFQKEKSRGKGYICHT
jgi:hypothetical protein